MNIKYLCAILTLGIGISIPAYAFEGKDNTYASMLVSGSNELVILGAQSLYYEKSSNTELLDIVAELLWYESKHESYITSDGLSWLAKTLGQSKLTRYKTVLKDVDVKMAALEKKYKQAFKFDDDDEEDAEESEPVKKTSGSLRPSISSWGGTIVDYAIDGVHTAVDHSKVRDFIAKALETLTDQSQADYVAGKLDYKRILDKITTSKQTHIKNRQEINFSSIKRGKYLKDVYSEIGLPDSPSAYFVSRTRVFRGRYVESRLQIRYGDAGIVQLLLDNDREGPGWYVYKVFSFQPNGLKAGLLSNDANQLRTYASNMYAAYLTDTSILDIAAQRLWDSMNTTDGQLGDALAWVCKSIGRSRQTRYRTLMQDVADNAQNAKAKKYAKRQLEYLTFGDEQQFVSYK